MAFENIVVGFHSPAGEGLRPDSRGALDRRWMITFGFGLVHGFGFSFALRETLQFAGSHVLSSLVAFNVGVELGQLLVLGLLIPALNLFFRHVVNERIGTILLSALVAHTAWHWAEERGSQLAQFPIPRLDLAMVASGMRLLMLVLIAGGLVWLVSTLLGRPQPVRADGQLPARTRE
jgi:hypothetical protein